MYLLLSQIYHTNSEANDKTRGQELIQKPLHDT